MTKHMNLPRIPLPGAWPQSIKVAMLHVIALAQYAMAHTRGWAVNSPIARERKHRYISIDPSTNGVGFVAYEVTLSSMLRCADNEDRACPPMHGRR